MNRKGFGRNQSWSNPGTVPCISVGEARETKKTARTAEIPTENLQYCHYNNLLCFVARQDTIQHTIRLFSRLKASAGHRLLLSSWNNYSKHDQILLRLHSKYYSFLLHVILIFSDSKWKMQNRVITTVVCLKLRGHCNRFSSENGLILLHPWTKSNYA
jgi:hypothetical protein